MFSVHCPRHGAEVLIGTRAITGIDNRRSGMIVRWRCTCGHEGAFITGRAAGRRGSSLDAIA